MSRGIEAEILPPCASSASRDRLRHPLARPPEQRDRAAGPGRKACSGRSSCLPSTISRKPRIVSASSTYLPGVPVNVSATKKGWERKRWIFRARATVSLSSSDSSSMPRIAMMSWRSL